MKKVFLLTIVSTMMQLMTACKKTEVASIEQLNNSTWTGFFKYKPVRENDNMQFVLTQCFAVSFLSNGVFKFYEALGESGGTWTLGDDNTVTITQTNKNIIKFDYNPNAQTLTFKSLTGAPDEWIASNMEKSNSTSASKMENVKWYYPSAGYYIVIKKDDFNESYFETLTGRQAVKIFQTVILQSGRVFIYRNNDELYNTTATGPYTGITFKLVKQ
jgi:hypothetical protein